MVFKSIERIKNALPEVSHIIMFYNNGIVFETTLDQSINIPKIGEIFAQIVENFKQIYNLTKFDLEKYNKIICETEAFSIILLKLGEESNIALFFKAEESRELKLSAIRRYLLKIEELIDMDKNDIIIQNILKTEEEIRLLKEELEVKQKNIKELKDLSEKPIETTESEYEVTFAKKCDELEKLCYNIEETILEKEKLIDSLKEEIRKKKSHLSIDS
ncbi:MAG: hypothetical protein BAJALOKI3v1_860011 [Promethearchaeota archaeon]|jgi:predicted regulator of Ras-like GTPase activity (Roadblock/LC7/MglB family)|nr:MAG: hypothetical protein BAJALOKI3v1_860011 [Candidatus Lokiarchaeota archaeon]